MFFFNPSTKTSVWERPSELRGRPDVDKLVKSPPDNSQQQQQPSDKKHEGNSNRGLPGDDKNDTESSGDKRPASEMDSVPQESSGPKKKQR